MYYRCPQCGKKFKYAIDLIPEFGDASGPALTAMPAASWREKGLGRKMTGRMKK